MSWSEGCRLAVLLSLSAGISAASAVQQSPGTTGRAPVTAAPTAPSQKASLKPKAEPPAVAGQKPLAELPSALKSELGNATALNPETTVFLDAEQKRVLLRTEVACPDCILEMVLVPEGNREHETILRIRSKAFVIHTALLALGLEPGKPASFTPKFTPPAGPVLDISAVWVDESGKVQRRPLQEWVRYNTHRYHAAPLTGPPPGVEMPYRNLRWDKFNNEILWYGPMSVEERDDLLSKWKNADYRKAIERFFQDGQSRPMTADFVFAGSSMFKDEETGQEFYQAEGGHLICTSNFPDALMDIREESSASDGAQTYEGWTERIPPEGTPVLLVLMQQQQQGKPKAERGSEDGSK